MRKPKRSTLLIMIGFLPLLWLLLELFIMPHLMRGTWAEAMFGMGNYAKAQDLYSRQKAKAPSDSIATANLAKALYKRGQYSAAADSLRDMDSDDAGAATLYDLGNIAFQNEDYASSVDYYRRALLKNSGDWDTKANYELALRKLDEETPPSQNSGDEDKDDQQQQKPDESQKEDIENILNALDQKEALDRQNQNDAQPRPSRNWW